MSKATETLTTTSANTPLNRELIAATALQLANEVGVENLSARQLSAALGKSTMAIYRHFSSMDEIKMAAVALAFREVDAEPIPGETWDATLRRTMNSIRDLELRYARARLDKMERSGLSPELIEHTERIQSLHSNQGIPEEILKKLWRIVDAYLTGFLLNELEELEELEAAAAKEDADLPAWAETVQRAYTEKSFNDGINIIIAGVRALAAPDPCNWHTPLA